MTKRWVPKNDLTEKKQKMRIVQKICPLKIRKTFQLVLINKYKCAFCARSHKTAQIILIYLEWGLEFTLYNKILHHYLANFYPES